MATIMALLKSRSAQVAASSVVSDSSEDVSTLSDDALVNATKEAGRVAAFFRQEKENRDLVNSRENADIAEAQEHVDAAMDNIFAEISGLSLGDVNGQDVSIPLSDGELIATARDAGKVASFLRQEKENRGLVKTRNGNGDESE